MPLNSGTNDDVLYVLQWYSCVAIETCSTTWFIMAPTHWAGQYSNHQLSTFSIQTWSKIFSL